MILNPYREARMTLNHYRDSHPRRGRGALPDCGVGGALAAVCAPVMGMAVFGIVVAPALETAGPVLASPWGSSERLMVAIGVQNLLFLGAAAAALRRRKRRPWDTADAWKSMLLGRLKPGAHGTRMLLALILVVVLAPAGEEILFRGVLFGSLRPRLGTAAAAAFSGALFAALHCRLEFFPALAMIGIMLAFLYARTRSLGACIIAHGVNNAAVIVLLRGHGG